MSHDIESIKLREISLADAGEIQRILDDEEIHNNTLTIPSPLPAGWAHDWIESRIEDNQKGSSLSLSIISEEEGGVVGVVSFFDISKQHEHAEIGYFIGRHFRRKGYATRAVKSMIDYGFSQLGLSRIYGYHFEHNTGSGLLFQKLGFKQEGCLRNHIKKNGVFVNSVIYGLLKKDL